MLQARRGRCISSAAGRPWMIYTDACYEPTAQSWICGLGAILVSPDGVPAAMFSTCLDKEQMVNLGAKDKKSIIFEAELLVMVLAIKVWHLLVGHTPLRFGHGMQATFGVESRRPAVKETVCAYHPQGARLASHRG